MTNMLAGAALMDGAILVIAANEPVPMPQTREHMLALQMLGMKKMVIVQNKIDRVDSEGARKNYEAIKNVPLEHHRGRRADHPSLGAARHQHRRADRGDRGAIPTPPEGPLGGGADVRAAELRRQQAGGGRLTRSWEACSGAASSGESSTWAKR